MAKVLNEFERHQWLIERAKNSLCHSLNVLDVPLVDAYTKKTNAKVHISMWGANKCPLLSKDLKDLHKSGVFISTISLGCNWQPGFPKWVRTYTLTPNGE